MRDWRTRNVCAAVDIKQCAFVRDTIGIHPLARHTAHSVIAGSAIAWHWRSRVAQCFANRDQVRHLYERTFDHEFAKCGYNMRLPASHFFNLGLYSWLYVDFANAMPPSTVTVDPTTKSPARDAKKIAAPAMSSAVPIRFAGVRAADSAS